MNYVDLLLQESHLVVLAKDESSLKPRVVLAELAGSEEIPSNCEESVKYIAVKCFIIPRAEYNHQYINVLNRCTWGEKTLKGVYGVLKCFVQSPRYNAMWPNIYIYNLIDINFPI